MEHVVSSRVAPVPVVVLGQSLGLVHAHPAAEQPCDTHTNRSIYIYMYLYIYQSVGGLDVKLKYLFVIVQIRKVVKGRI